MKEKETTKRNQHKALTKTPSKSAACIAACKINTKNKNK